MPKEFPTANFIFQIDAEVHGNLLREHGHKFAELLEQEKMTKLCSNAVSKNIEKGQFFIALDDEDDALNDRKRSWRTHILPRSEEASRVRGWILGNTKISPFVDVEVCCHQGR